MDENRKAQAKLLLKDLLVDSRYYPAHIKLTETIGLVEAMVLQQHVYFQSVKGDRYHGVRKKIEQQFQLSLRIQRPVENKLVSLGFLYIDRKPESSYNYYTVDASLVRDFVKLSYQNRLDYVEKAYAKLNDNQEVRGSDKMSRGGRDKMLPLKLDRKDIDTDNKLSVKGFDKPLSVGTKKSRLMDKGNLPDNYVVPKNSLVDRTSSTVQQNKRAAIAIPERTRQCIEYWNKFPELVEHRITPDNPTKTLAHIVRLLGSFLAGNFLDVVAIPNGFEDHSWFNRKPSVDDFCDLVDDFVKCLRSPDLKPDMNGTRTNMLTFLNGNKYGENGGIESLMLIYCFGPYKTVMVDKFPDTTKLIKDIWLKYVGKYKETPETEKAFIVASKLCHMRYNEKREEEDGWIPAMNDYRPEGIVRQILISKAEWLKKEKIQPDLMAYSKFGSYIRRYDYDRKTGSMVL